MRQHRGACSSRTRPRRQAERLQDGPQPPAGPGEAPSGSVAIGDAAGTMRPAGAAPHPRASALRQRRRSSPAVELPVPHIGQGRSFLREHEGHCRLNVTVGTIPTRRGSRSAVRFLFRVDEKEQPVVVCCSRWWCLASETAILISILRAEANPSRCQLQVEEGVGTFSKLKGRHKT